MKKTKFKFPKAMAAVAGATAMMFSTGFISNEPNEIIEEELFELEEEVTFGTTYRNTFTCEGTGGNCLPTFVCCDDKE